MPGERKKEINKLAEKGKSLKHVKYWSLIGNWNKVAEKRVKTCRGGGFCLERWPKKKKNIKKNVLLEYSNIATNCTNFNAFYPFGFPTPYLDPHLYLEFTYLDSPYQQFLYLISLIIMLAQVKFKKLNPFTSIKTILLNSRI